MFLPVLDPVHAPHDSTRVKYSVSRSEHPRAAPADAAIRGVGR